MSYDEFEAERKLVNEGLAPRPGLSNEEFEALIDYQGKEKKSSAKATVSNQKSPVYPRIHRDYLDEATLQYWEIPYQIDPNDGNYLIILREMDDHQTNMLFEVTKRYRREGILQETIPGRGVHARNGRTRIPKGHLSETVLLESGHSFEETVEDGQQVYIIDGSLEVEEINRLVRLSEQLKTGNERRVIRPRTRIC